MKTFYLDIPANLSEQIYEDAKYLAKVKAKPEPTSLFEGLLVVSVWDADLAIHVATTYKDCDVKIDRNYRKNEWAFQPYGFDFQIYSPGA